MSGALRPEFLSGLPFELDPFQLEAMDALVPLLQPFVQNTVHTPELHGSYEV